MAVIPLESILSILILIVLVSIIARIIRLPYTIALIFAGLLSSMFSPLSLPHISPETFLTMLLPPLVFQAATRINFTDVQKDADVISSFAFAGTLISAFLIGVLSYLFLGFNFLEALLLGIIISPTDPVAVISTLRKLGVSKKLTLIIEGESLFNDGVVVVAYSAIIPAFLSGVLDVLGMTEGILFSIVVGAVIGGLIGYVTYKIVLFTDDNFVKIILTFLATYGSYQTATYLNGSGIISVALTGLIIGYFVREAQPKETVEVLDVVWDFASFLVTSISFVLIGMYVDISLFWEYLWMIALSIAIVMASRAVTVYGLSAVLRLRKKVLPRSWQDLIIWSGLRGVVSIMLVLGLPTLPMPHAEEITAITFGVVFFSILFQGLAVRLFIKKYKLSVS